MLAALAIAAPAASATEKLDWHDCDDGFQCATAVVPQDYAEPHGPKVRLAVNKHPALDREHRIGSLFLNPGGRGGSGVAFVRFAPPAAFRLLSRFDWIGWDPRGVGESRPAIDCDEAPAFEPMTPDTFDLPTLLARGRATSTGCAPGSARGSSNLVGISWGGQLGETYASLFPGRTRALLLDSPVDGDIWLNHPLRARLQQNASYEHSLQRFLAWAGISEDELDARLDADPDLHDVIESAEDIFAVATHFAHGTYEGVLDLFWPVRARGAFYGPYRHAEDAPSALVLHTTHDLELPPPGARCDQAPVSPSSKKSSSIARSSSAAAWMR